MAAIEKLTGNFTETDIDDEIILMRLDSGELLTLDGPAAATWRLIDGERDRQALIEALAADYGERGQQISADVGRFLAELQDAGLVAKD